MPLRCLCINPICFWPHRPRSNASFLFPRPESCHWLKKRGIQNHSFGIFYWNRFFFLLILWTRPLRFFFLVLLVAFDTVKEKTLHCPKKIWFKWYFWYFGTSAFCPFSEWGHNVLAESPAGFLRGHPGLPAEHFLEALEVWVAPVFGIALCNKN